MAVLVGKEEQQVGALNGPWTGALARAEHRSASRADEKISTIEFAGHIAQYCTPPLGKRESGFE